MKILIMIPTRHELEGFLSSCEKLGKKWEQSTQGKLIVFHLPGDEVTAAGGGLGKTQFAIHTQHLIEAMPRLDLVICAGAAGALSDQVSIGDIVVATETVEHDLRNKIGEPLLPRHRGDGNTIDIFKKIASSNFPFKVYFGPVASGDEDIVDAERRNELRHITGALAVAWEGAGGARAAGFHEVPYVEIRGISDNADTASLTDFKANLNRVMEHIAALIMEFINYN
jgi:adenosylhomocysteine nucleosidase